MSGVTLRSSKPLLWSALFLLVLAIASSCPNIRSRLTVPLVMHNGEARGDACYVLAGGGSLWERLDAAADLVQMNRVPIILLMREDTYGQYSFKARSSWTRTQWATDYLSWRGVPNNRVVLLPQVNGMFGTLAEARSVSKYLPKNIRRLILVSSAPHMRRAMLAFGRSLPAGVRAVPYAATTVENSYELYYPIWLEYLKLMVYYLVA